MFFSLTLGRFYGIDSLIELMIVLVAAIISLYSRKIYKIVKENNYRYFSWAFLSIAIAYLFKICSNLTITNRVRIEGINFAYIVFSQPKYMPIVDFFSFILYKTFTLIGFLILFLIVTKTDKKDRIALYIYLSIITLLFSIYFNFIFHMTLMIILLFLTYHFYKNYKEHDNTNTLLVYLAFLIISVSHFLFMFSDMNSVFYIMGEGSLLIGFALLLANQIKIKLFIRKIEKNSIKVDDNKKADKISLRNK